MFEINHLNNELFDIRRYTKINHKTHVLFVYFLMKRWVVINGEESVFVDCYKLLLADTKTRVMTGPRI